MHLVIVGQVGGGGSFRGTTITLFQSSVNGNLWSGGHGGVIGYNSRTRTVAILEGLCVLLVMKLLEQEQY